MVIAAGSAPTWRLAIGGRCEAVAGRETRAGLAIGTHETASGTSVEPTSMPAQ